MLQVFAGTIQAERSARPERAVQAFQQAVAEIGEPEKQFDVLAQVVCRYLGAEFAIIYRPVGAETEKQLTVVGVAGPVRNATALRHGLAVPRDSLTYAAFRQDRILRVADIEDAVEVMAKCGRASDQLLLGRLRKVVGAIKAWMVGPVRVRSLRGNKWSILQIKVLNKVGRYYLHDGFTRTDVRILARLIEHLALHLPWLETQMALADVTMAVSSWSESLITRPQMLADRMVDRLSKHMFGITALCFHMPFMPPLISKKGGDLAELPWRGLEFRKVYQLTDADGESALCIPIASGAMLVQVAKADMPLYEFDILCRTAVAVGGLVQYVSAYRAAGQRLIETRHAVRSANQAMLGASLAALKTFQFTCDFRDMAVRELRDNRSFGRNLMTSARAAAHAAELLEEARWTVGVEGVKLDLGQHSLSGLIEDVLFFAHLEAIGRRIKVNFNADLPDDADSVTCDRSALLVLLHNVVENAVRYSYAAQPVRVAAAIADGFWTVAVANRGMHIPADKLRDIFSPYVRYLPADAKQHKKIDSKPGTGLGLAICRRIIAAHDRRGRIDCQSTLGEDGIADTLFTITLPVNPSPTPEA